MATTASDSIPNLNPSSSSSAGISNENNVNNSPRNRRNPRNFSSPWANIVRESVPAAPSSPSSSTMIASKDQSPPDSDSSPAKVSSSFSSDISAAEIPPDISDSGNSNAAKSKKPAWNKPSNGVDVSPVMGAVSWPALSESAKASPKSSSESLKGLSDLSASASQVPVVAASPQKPVNANANPNSAPNHPYPTKQKSFKRGGGSGGSANGGSSQLHLHPPPVVDMPQNNSPKTAPVVLGNSPRDAAHKSHTWEGGQRTGQVLQPNTGNDHPQQRNSFRRGGGGHHRGDGSNHYSHGNRRDQDRANHESNPPHRGFNGRDGHMQQRVNQRNFVRPMQPSTAPFVSPPPVRPFGNPLGFPDMAPPVYYVPTPPPDSLRGVPFIHTAPFAMIVPAPDPLRAVLAKQIEYYFSPENLCKDIFLRKYMDGQGWVPISLIANFNRVKQLTNNIQFILDSVRTSTIVEVQGDKIRKRNDWMNWTLLQSHPASAPDSLSTGTTHDMLTNRIQNVGLEEGYTANGASSENITDQSKAFSGDGQDKLHY